MLVDFKYKREIGRLDLEKGLRALMHHFPEDVLEVEVEEPGILLDIDTPEDYSIAKNQINNMKEETIRFTLNGKKTEITSIHPYPALGIKGSIWTDRNQVWLWIGILWSMYHHHEQ